MKYSKYLMLVGISLIIFPSLIFAHVLSDTITPPKANMKMPPSQAASSSYTPPRPTGKAPTPYTPISAPKEVVPPNSSRGTASSSGSYDLAPVVSGSSTSSSNTPPRPTGKAPTPYTPISAPKEVVPPNSPRGIGSFSGSSSGTSSSSLGSNKATAGSFPGSSNSTIPSGQSTSTYSKLPPPIGGQSSTGVIPSAVPVRPTSKAPTPPQNVNNPVAQQRPTSKAPTPPQNVSKPAAQQRPIGKAPMPPQGASKSKGRN